MPASFLEEIRGRYHLTLIDCPPNLHLCSWAALVASDYLIVPLQPEDYGGQGIAEVQDSVVRVVSGPNPGIRLLGYLITMVQARRSIHQLYEAQLRGAYGDGVFAARVPEATEFVEAVARRMPIAQYKPKGAAAKAIKSLAEELLARLEAGAVARATRRPHDMGESRRTRPVDGRQRPGQHRRLPSRRGRRKAHAGSLGPGPMARCDQEQERGRDPPGEDRARSRPASG